MDSIIAIDMKLFLSSNSLISDHQFGFRLGHSTLDMLLLFTHQWMEALNVRHEIRAVSLAISRACATVWHPALLSKLSAHSIQGQLHTWLTTSSTLMANMWLSTESSRTATAQCAGSEDRSSWFLI